MKRRALGKGLSSLIPAPQADVAASVAAEPPAPATAQGIPAGPPPGDDNDQWPAITMSAADISTGNAVPVGTERVPAPGQGAGEYLREIDVLMITPNPSQPRQAISEEQLDELAASIRTSGVLQPVLVRPHRGAYQLIAGERRWRAAQKAGLERIPAIVREVADGKLLEVALIENIQRQELNPIEEARAYQALQREGGATQSEVADRVGKQRSTVANTVRLLKLAPSVQAQVERGVLAMGHARALLGLLDASAQETTAQVIVNKGLNVRQAEELVRRQNEPPKPPGPPPRRDPNVAAAEQGLSQQLGTKVRIVAGMKGKGRLVIEFYSAEELDRIYERLMAH